MANHFSLVMSCIDSVLDIVRGRSSKRWQLNEHQCSYLAEELLKVSQSLQAKLESGTFKPAQGIQKIVLLHLHAAVKRAQLLVERCCCETSASWRVAAMTSTDIKEEVITIVLNLHQWTSVLDIAIASVEGRPSKANLECLKAGEEVYQRLFKKLHSSTHPLQVAALQDQKTLLANIAEYAEDDYVYGVYLKSRLAPMGGEVQSVPQLKAYKVSRALGQGASGMVLEVTWMGHQCGLKISKGIDKTEATILDRLHHPNIVRFFHYWEVPPPDRNSYMVMELLPSDLQKHILRELSRPSSQSRKKCAGVPFILSAAIDLMFQVAAAMQHVHDQKLTHRDLKTSNILVKPVLESMSELHSQGYLEVKLADFGMAEGYIDSSISEGLTPNIGTTIYGAPEIFGQEETQTHKNFPPKADVWSFGMVCSEILTGRMPFSEERSRAELHKRIRFEGLRPSFPKDCPAYLQFCITSCWELQPQRRPSFTDLCRMLRHAQLLNLGLICLEDAGCLFGYSNRAGLMNTMSINSTSSQVDSVKSRFRGGIGLISSFRNIGRGHKPMQPTIEDANDETLQPTLGIVRQMSKNKEDINVQLLLNANKSEEASSESKEPLRKQRSVRGLVEEESKLRNEKQAEEEDITKRPAAVDGTKATWTKPKSLNRRTCAICQLQTRRRCADCKSVFYCSRKCQKKHWHEVHRFECPSLCAKLNLRKLENTGTTLERMDGMMEVLETQTAQRETEALEAQISRPQIEVARFREIDVLSTQAVTTTVKLSVSKNQNCRQQAARQLRMLVEGEQHITEFKQAGGIAALLLLLEDPNLNCRQDALVALQALPPSAAIPVGELPLESILDFLIQKGPDDVTNAAIGLFDLMVKGKAVSADKFLESEGALEAMLRLLDTDSDSPGSQKSASVLLVMAKEDQSIRTRIAEPGLRGLDIFVKYVRDHGNNKVKELLTATLVLFCRDGETYQEAVIAADGHRFLITSLHERISKEEAAQGLLELIKNTCNIEIVLDGGFVSTATGSIDGRFACIDIALSLSRISSIQEGLNQIYLDRSSVPALLILLEHCSDPSGKNAAALIISRLYPLLCREEDSVRRESITEKCQLLLNYLDPFDPHHVKGFLQALAALAAEPEGRRAIHQSHGHRTLINHLSVTDTEIQGLVLKILSEMSSDVCDNGFETYETKIIRVTFMDIRVGEKVFTLLRSDEFSRRTESMKDALILIRNLSLAGAFAFSQLVEEGAVIVLLEILKLHERFLPIVTELALKALEKVLDDPNGKAEFNRGEGIKTLVAIVKVDASGSAGGASGRAGGASGRAGDASGRAGDAFGRASVATIILIAVAEDRHSRRHAIQTMFDGDIFYALNRLIFYGPPGKIKWQAAVLMRLLAMHGPSKVFVALKEEGCLDALIYLRSIADCNAVAVNVLNFVSEKNKACRTYIQENRSS